MTEVLTRRAELEATVIAIRHGGRTVAPLQWDRTFAADERHTTLSDLAQLAGISAPTGAPVVVEALRLSRLLPCGVPKVGPSL